MTKEEIEAIRERADKATQGPWVVGKRSPNGIENIGHKGRMVAQAWLYNDAQLNNDTAEFIAHAREDIPALLAEVEKLNAEIADRETSHIELYNENKRMEDEVKRLQAQLNGGEA